MPALFVVNKYTEFVGNPIRFDASGSTGPITIYEWDTDDGAVPIFATSAASADYSYQNYGLRLPSLTVWETSASNTYTLPVGITVNPHPHISISGVPAVNSAINFTDTSGPYYINGSVPMIAFNYGDGSLQVSGAPTDIFSHQFSAAGNYQISLSAIDTESNISIDTRTISILVGDICKTKPEYVSLCGPDNRRFGSCKSINLTNFLSDYLQETDVYDLVKFFEDFLNTMYSGLCGFQTVETNLNASATQLAFSTPAQNLSTDPRISILEKIKRLTELHDPDLIDIEYIQFFAKYLGYNVEISRGEIGGFGSFETSATVCSASENEKYLRFMVANLPNWYKIKTTRDMIKVMLYSFGLVGDIIQYYTKPIAQGGYDRNFVNWKPDDNDDLATIPNNWFPTPHFSVKIDLDRSIEENPDVYNILNILMNTGDKIIRAIESVRPINTIFHNLTAITTEYIDIWVGAQTRFSRYIHVDPDGYADWWVTNTPAMVKYIIDSYADFSSDVAAFKTIMGNYINSLQPGTDVRFSPLSTYANSGIPINSYVKDIIINGSTMMAAVYGTDGGIYISIDDGATWAISSTGMPSMRPTCFAKMGTNLYVGTAEYGVFISTDSGATWAAHNTGFTTAVIRDLYVNSNNIYAATDVGVFVKSEPGDWENLSLFGGMSDVDTNCVLFNTVDNYIYAGTLTGGVFRSNGGAWEAYPTFNNLFNLNVLSLAVYQGSLMAGTDGYGVWGYASGDWYPQPFVTSAENSVVVTLFVDQNDNLIIGTSVGAFIYTSNWPDHFIGLHGGVYAFVEKGISLYAGYSNGRLAIIDKSKTVEGLLKRQNNTFELDNDTTFVTMYKNNVISTDPIPMTITQQPTFDSVGTEINYLTS